MFGCKQREGFEINFLRKTPQFASLARTPPSERLEIDVFRVEVDDSRPNDFSYHPRLQISFLMTPNGLERRGIHEFCFVEAHRDFLCDASEDFRVKVEFLVATLG